MTLVDYRTLLIGLPEYEPWQSVENHWPALVERSNAESFQVYLVDWLYGPVKKLYDYVDAIFAGVEIEANPVQNQVQDYIGWLIQEFEGFGLLITVSIVGFVTYTIKNYIQLGKFEYGKRGYGEGPVGAGPIGSAEVVREIPSEEW